MKKILCIVLLSMLWILTGCASKSVDQIDVKAYVYPNGDLYVEEVHTYLFEGEHSEVERNLEEVGRARCRRSPRPMAGPTRRKGTRGVYL